MQYTAARGKTVAFPIFLQWDKTVFSGNADRAYENKAFEANNSFFLKCPPAFLMESFNAKWKFISGDYSCGVNVITCH